MTHAIALPQPSEALHLELDELDEINAQTETTEFADPSTAKASPSPELRSYLQALIQAIHERLVAIPLSSPLRVDARALAWIAGRMLGAQPESKLHALLQDLSQEKISQRPPKSPASLDAYALLDFIAYRGPEYPKKAPPAKAAREFASYALWGIDPESRARVWSHLRRDRLPAALAVTQQNLPPAAEIAALNQLFFPPDASEPEPKLPATATDPLPPTKHPFNATRWTIFLLFLAISVYHLTCR